MTRERGMAKSDDRKSHYTAPKSILLCGACYKSSVLCGLGCVFVIVVGDFNDLNHNVVKQAAASTQSSLLACHNTFS